MSIVIKGFYSGRKQKPQNFQHHRSGHQEITVYNAQWAIPGLYISQKLCEVETWDCSGGDDKTRINYRSTCLSNQTNRNVLVLLNILNNRVSTG